MTEASVVVCTRVEDVAHGTPGSLPAPCRSCGKMVWRGPVTLRMTGRLEYQCIPCVAADRSLDPSTFLLTDEGYEYVVKHIGLYSREQLTSWVVAEIHRMRGDG